MGSNFEDGAINCGSHETGCSDSAIEIKIKTLDSQIHTVRVDKHVPILALKEQVAAVTGVILQQQRLLYQGKVLKNDQILSAYNVEDGYVLHLVDGPTIPSSSEDMLDNSATYPASSSGNTQSRQVRPVTLLVLDNPQVDLNRIFSTLSSSQIATTGRNNEEVDLGEPSLERLSESQNLNALRSSSRCQPDLPPECDQSNSSNVTTSQIQSVLESLQPPVISDSITTLSQFLNHLRREFDINRTGAQHRSLPELYVDHHAAHRQRGLPRPASLAEVMMSTRQLLLDQVAAFLFNLARQLMGQAEVTDSSTRMDIQMNARRSGSLLQNVGAMLLELGRTTRMMQLGETPADAIILAGPSVYISTSGFGPNHIMIAGLDSEDDPPSTAGAKRPKN